MRAVVLLMFGLAASAACSSKQVTVEPAGDLARISRNIQIDVRSAGMHRYVASDLERYLEGNLIIEGFDVGDDLPDALVLRVDVHEFDPGDAGLRITVGFGAGRASLLYTARYFDPQGALLAELQGQERFTGGEPHFNDRYGTLATLGGAEKAREILVQEAVRHIIELGRGELRTEERAEKQKGRQRKVGPGRR